MAKTNTKADLAAIEKLLASRGWAILKQVFEDDLMRAAKDMAKNPNMPEAEMHYRRGAIGAAERAAQAPELIAAVFRNHLALTPGKDDLTP